jgi:hypothetical protein
MKQAIFSSRWLLRFRENAKPEDVKPVCRGHRLRDYWESVLKEVKPKIPAELWDRCDIQFVESCVREFDTVDPKGVAFRYNGEGGETCQFDFAHFLVSMEHAYQVLQTITGCLFEIISENADWEAMIDEEERREREGPLRLFAP